jgi:hypothetical protein
MEKNRYRFSKEIFLASLEVHKIMGPGLLESVYEMSFERIVVEKYFSRMSSYYSFTVQSLICQKNIKSIF